MQLTLHKTVRFGLEVFQVRIDGRLHCEFLSESAAKSAFLKLFKKLGGIVK